MLLIPAALIGVGRGWAPILAVLSGLCLTFGLFPVAQTGRHPKSFGDAFCLWTQTVAVLAVAIGGLLSTRADVRRRSAVTRG
jgi:hypothetical protein